MDESGTAGSLGQRAAGVAVIVLIATFLLATGSASGQTSGQAHVALVQGGDSLFRFSGLSGGGGVLFRNQIGVQVELGLIGDNSDERDVIPIFSVGGSVHFSGHQGTRKLVPFVAAGFTTLWDGPGWYAGGGGHYWFRRATAILVDVRGVVPSPTDTLARLGSSVAAWLSVSRGEEERIAASPWRSPMDSPTAVRNVAGRYPAVVLRASSCSTKSWSGNSVTSGPRESTA